MPRFFHHPDGFIVIEGEVDITLSVEFFRRFAPDYGLPEGHVGREYIPNVVHRTWNADGAYPTEETTWAEGDGYIARAREFSLAYRQFQDRQLQVKSSNFKERKVKPLWP